MFTGYLNIEYKRSFNQSLKGDIDGQGVQQPELKRQPTIKSLKAEI